LRQYKLASPGGIAQLTGTNNTTLTLDDVDSLNELRYNIGFLLYSTESITRQQHGTLFQMVRHCFTFSTSAGGRLWASIIPDKKDSLNLSIISCNLLYEDPTGRSQQHSSEEHAMIAAIMQAQLASEQVS
jgi:hypothetical protein